MYTPEGFMIIAKVLTIVIVIFSVYQFSDIITEWYHYLKG